MTAKQAVKARYRDCSGRKCGFDYCALKGLVKSKGESKAKGSFGQGIGVYSEIAGK